MAPKSLFLLAVLLIGCDQSYYGKDNAADKDLSVEVLRRKADASWEKYLAAFDSANFIDRQLILPDHYWSYLWLNKVCEVNYYPDNKEEWCSRAVFFPRSDRCFEHNDIDACERATHVSCYMCDLFRPHILNNIERLRAQ